MRGRRRHRLVLLVTFLVAASIPGGAPAASTSPTVAAGETWVGSWATAPVKAAEPPVRDQSVRIVAHLSVGGPKLRVRLSNAFGAAPATFDSVRVAIRTRGPAVDPDTDHRVTFGGSPSVTVPAGQETFSDPVPLATEPGEDVAVSVHVADAPGGATWHPLALAQHYAGPPGGGDVTGDTTGTSFPSRITSTYFVTGIDVQSDDAHSVVALGDSITDGANSTPETNGRWPDNLARMLRDNGHEIGVLNAGISANTVTDTGSGLHGGEPAVDRFDRDVLGQSGARAVILFEGSNDLAVDVPAAEIIAGLSELASRADAAGMAVVGATILPRACDTRPGSGWDLTTHEPAREKVNDWIRTAPEFDAVADLDAAMKDPARDTCLDRRYDSGDGLHPNQLGMRKIAEEIPLEPLNGS